MLGQVKAATSEGVGKHHLNISQQPAEMTGKHAGWEQTSHQQRFLFLLFRYFSSEQQDTLQTLDTKWTHTHALGGHSMFTKQQKIVTIYNFDGHFLFKLYASSSPTLTGDHNKKIIHISICMSGQQYEQESKNCDWRWWKQHCCFSQPVDEQKKEKKDGSGRAEQSQHNMNSVLSVLITSVPASQNRHFWNS